MNFDSALVLLGALESEAARRKMVSVLRTEFNHHLKMAANITPDPNLSRVEKNFARDGLKLEAVRAYGKRTGEGLLESNNRVEKWMDENHLR